MDYEAHILKLLSTKTSPSLLSQQSTVQSARLVSYDVTQKLLCISDSGTRTLKAAYNDAQLDIPKTGRELAQWVATLQQDSKSVSLALSSQDAASRGCQNNNPVALHLYRHSHDNLHMALSEFGHDAEVGFRINVEFGSLITSDDECICHGELWPGNVLIQPGSGKGGDVQLTVVDWELVRRGTSATDVGQFAAEASLRDRFKGGRGLLAAFLGCYVNARRGSIDKTWVKRMVVHWAVHVAYWPTRVQWTDREGTRQLVDMGVDALKKVLDGDWGQLLELPLLRDVEEILRSLFV